MEVKKPKPKATLVSEFWPYYERRALIIALSAQVPVLLLIVSIIAVLFPDIPMGAWIMVGVVSTIALTVTVIATGIILKPLKDVANALAHVAGERTAVPPPRMNDDYYERARMRPMLEAIYDLATKEAVEPVVVSESGTRETTVDIEAQLNHTATGVVMMNAERKIVYANKSAPVHVDSNGLKTLQLIFDVDPSIDAWLNERTDHDIHAEKAWRRIANKLTGEQDRKLYDVFVSYEKGSEAETVITLFDRTGEYQPEDDDLDFIAFAAHELRGPITVIRGYLDTLNDELAQITDNDQKELFQRLIVSANRLSGYINNILNASRFDRRHLKVHLNEMSVASIYESIADDMSMRAVAQQRLLSVDIPATLPTVAADLNSMSEVFGNLIDNAIKYSNDGGAIEVTASAGSEYVDISVTDYGIGMPANVIANLFHKFYRSHRSRETVAGTGIGLYISKAIAESNGGKISVRSVEGRGSTFTVSLPIYATVAAKLQASGGTNKDFIESSSSGWIKNHGAFRG